MTLKTKIREMLIKLTGYWIYKHRDLSIGCDLMNDLRFKINLPLNVIFDVGANTGQTAQKFRTFFKDSAIYCFEPVADTYKLLLKNVSGQDKINSFKIALGDTNGQTKIKLFKDALVLSTLNQKLINFADDDFELIDVSTGDNFCLKNNISEIDLLKIDTEGFEIQVLNGFKNMIAKKQIKSIYCEVGFDALNIRNTNFTNLIEMANAVGFKFYGLYEINNTFIKSGNNYGNALFLHESII